VHDLEAPSDLHVKEYSKLCIQLLLLTFSGHTDFGSDMVEQRALT
jgi:hypothetical protein